MYQLNYQQPGAESSVRLDLLKYLCSSSEQQYILLCQDYQKWNNLRVWNVIKEGDLNNLSVCTSDAFRMKNFIYVNRVLHLLA
jgi:hypothetical protein